MHTHDNQSQFSWAQHEGALLNLSNVWNEAERDSWLIVFVLLLNFMELAIPTLSAVFLMSLFMGSAGLGLRCNEAQATSRKQITSSGHLLATPRESFCLFNVLSVITHLSNARPGGLRIIVGTLLNFASSIQTCNY